jgi:hypothetical protein
LPTPQIPLQPADLNGDGDTLDPGEPANDGLANANNDGWGLQEFSNHLVMRLMDSRAKRSYLCCGS